MDRHSRTRGQRLRPDATTPWLAEPGGCRRDRIDHWGLVEGG
jgi:hypothetical protein